MWFNFLNSIPFFYWTSFSTCSIRLITPISIAEGNYGNDKLVLITVLTNDSLATASSWIREIMKLGSKVTITN